MKLTNIKQLIIKFMGGGIINFPTRFLRWVKIDGISDGSDDGGGGGGGGDASIDELMEAFGNFDISINPAGAEAMASSEYLDNGSKNSFSYGYTPTANAVSVPIENYINVTNWDVYKLLMAIQHDQTLFIGVDGFGGYHAGLAADYISGKCVGGSSTVHSFGFNPIVKWDGSKNVFDGVALTINEHGHASTSYPEVCFHIDPNDYTKCLVEPEDL